jgi:hypothetical protein
VVDPVVDEFSQLLEKFSHVPLPPPPEQTILEIAGFAHYEIIASNILKFFLDPEQNHGLKTSVLEALLSAAGETVSDSDLDKATVEREVRTAAEKSIDLLIETASLVIAVENKIFAKPYNDFGEYARFTQEKAERSCKRAVLILLALSKIDPEDQNLAGFRPVAYQQFFDQLSPTLERAPATASVRYVSYLKDFRITIQNLVKRAEMFEPIREFIANNLDRVAKLENELAKLAKVMDGKLKNLAGQINVAPDPLLHAVVKSRRWDGCWSERLWLCDTWEIAVPGEDTLDVDVYLTPREWLIFAYRKGKNEDISKLLIERKFKPTIHPLEAPIRSWCFTVPYDADLGEIAGKVQSLIDALRRKDG